MQTGNTMITAADSGTASWPCPASISACSDSVATSVSSAVANGLPASATSTSGSDIAANGSWPCHCASAPIARHSASSPACGSSTGRAKAARTRPDVIDSIIGSSSAMPSALACHQVHHTDAKAVPCRLAMAAAPALAPSAGATMPATASITANDASGAWRTSPA
ncbi:hypothetical protein D3C81_1701350 [compost metagenome]